MRFHWQNLNEKAYGRKGWGIFHGRAWLRGLGMETNWEWNVRPKIELEASASIGGIHSAMLTLHMCLFGLGIYFGVSTKALARLYKWASRRDGLRTSIELAWNRSPTLRINLLSRDMSWRSDDPWYVKGISVDFYDLILGRTRVSDRVVETKETVIPMPEGCYAAKVEIVEWTRKRRRWFRNVRIGSRVDLPKCIPFAGKGENSWDCGDDGLWGQSSQAKTVEAAVAQVVESVLTTRSRQGEASNLQGKPPIMAETSR